MSGLFRNQELYEVDFPTAMAETFGDVNVDEIRRRCLHDPIFATAIKVIYHQRNDLAKLLGQEGIERRRREREQLQRFAAEPG